jgi:hypothetical protein
MVGVAVEDAPMYQCEMVEKGDDMVDLSSMVLPSSLGPEMLLWCAEALSMAQAMVQSAAEQDLNRFH